jgi:hypothetical protein
MTLEQVDRELQRLRQANERINASLLELELDPNRELLEKSQLIGQSAERWATTSAALTQLWQWRGLLEALLERAAGLRGGRRVPSAEQIASLGQLLEGESIEFTGQPVPLAERDLFGQSPGTRSCTPDELLARMSVAFEAVKSFLVDVGRAWDGFLPRLSAARSTLSASAELARSLGDAAVQELDATGVELTRLMNALARDPLSVTPDAVEALEASLERDRCDVEAIAELSRDIDRRLAGARHLFDELAHAQRETESAHREALAKISQPAVPEPSSLPADIAPQLTGVEELAKSGAWRDVRDALAAWTARVDLLIEQVRRTGAENRASIATRNQLRGLLDAYQAKARRLGPTEDTALADLYAQAHDALYTAPTDVDHAAELVRRYQRALPGNPTSREVLK